MKILITGICGFVGSRIALRLAATVPGIEINGIDNLSRHGSETNLETLKKHGVKVFHGDVRLSSDLRAIPRCDWVIDCAANPSVVAGVLPDSGCSAEQLVEHNLSGTLHILEYCRQHTAGMILLSTSRVYSSEALTRLPLRETSSRFEPEPAAAPVPGFSSNGIAENFSTTPPLSLYGATKLSSEIMALEYSAAFKFPVWINRCSVIGGPGQFGKADQGIFSFWVYSAALGRPLKYIGFGGSGKQVRDCMVPEDVADLIMLQMTDPGRNVPRICNIGGGTAAALSLRELTGLCESCFKSAVTVQPSPDPRPYDIPYFVTDTTLARRSWGWKPSKTGEEIILDICRWTSLNLEFVRRLF